MDTHSPTSHILRQLGVLGELSRSRLLAILEWSEFTVTELCSILQMPQSTVSRHLNSLALEGWVVSRADGTSRHYRMASTLHPDAQTLWGLVREEIRKSDLASDDVERGRAVLARRRERSREFFSTAAERWDELRGRLYGSRADLTPLFGLLDPEWTVGDLGAGTGCLTAQLAPFVRKVIAVDRSAEMLEAAQARLEGREEVELRLGDAEALPLADGELDVALFALVLHYLVDPLRALKEAGRALKRGGRLVVLDMRAHSRTEYESEMGHLWLGFESDQMLTWMAEAGFEGGRVVPVPPDPDAEGPSLFIATARRASE